MRHVVDLDNLPPLSEAQKAELAALAARPESEIDVSDIPELPDGAWKNAIRGSFYRPLKQQFTARLDADVLDWLKSQGPGYQTRMNVILRREMLAALKISGKKSG
ncbi:MAG: BrnA antitoxin family protein [Asticcacaulis sp.]